MAVSTNTSLMTLLQVGSLRAIPEESAGSHSDESSIEEDEDVIRRGHPRTSSSGLCTFDASSPTSEQRARNGLRSEAAPFSPSSPEEEYLVRPLCCFLRCGEAKACFDER